MVMLHWILPEGLARAGAGGLQVLQGRSDLDWAKLYFDDPQDMYYVNIGIRRGES